MYKLLIKSILTALFFYCVSNYVTAQTWSGNGNGTAASPYLITSAAELDEVRNFMVGVNYFRLENNIDLTLFLASGGTDGWQPIGDNSSNNFNTRFGGNFDGNGKKITGLWINRPLGWGPPPGNYEDYVGLFGAIHGANIYNLGIEIVSPGIIGRHKVGGLVGSAFNNSTITKVYTTGTVAGIDYIGGIIGESIFNTISNSYSTCDVNGSDYYVGGLIGIANNTSISNVYATGNVSTVNNGKIGGLTGVIVENSSISYAYATGNVKGNIFVGGLVGELQDDSSIKNCVVANGNIEALNGASFINRIASNELLTAFFPTITGNIFSQNYSINSGMTLLRAALDITGTITDNLNYLPGESKTLADLQTFNFYDTPGNWDGGQWDIALDNSKTWNIKDGSSFPFFSWQYAINASALTSFGTLYDVYVQPAQQTVIITSEGLNAVTLIQPVSTNYEIGTLSTTTLNVYGQTATFTVRPKAGLAAGTYNETILIDCNEGVSTTVNVSFTVISTWYPPSITGNSFMKLYRGYVTTSTNAFTITGNPTPTVTITSGDPLITWNGTTSKLDIAAGLPSGVYTVTLEATNGLAPDAQYTFTLTVEEPIYLVQIGVFTGGNIRSDISQAIKGQTVMLTITPYKDYELESIIVYRNDGSNSSIWLYGDYNYRSFTMPDCDVIVTAKFRYHGLHTAWEKAKPIIENAVFTVLQSKANTIADLKYALAEIINELIKGTGFVVLPSDIVILNNFQPATTGNVGSPSGINGYFEFRISPSIVNDSAYSDGTIIATPFNISANDLVDTNDYPSLKTWTQNGVLHVSGLTQGTKWYVYNMNGILIYQGTANGREANISLPICGIYIIINGTNSLKFTN